MEVSDADGTTALKAVGLRYVDELEPELGFAPDPTSPEWRDELNAFERAQVRALALTEERAAARTA